MHILITLVQYRFKFHKTHRQINNKNNKKKKLNRNDEIIKYSS